MSKKNKKKNKHAEGEQELVAKVDKKKLAARIMAGALAALMILGTLTMTIMYLVEAAHVH